MNATIDLLLDHRSDRSYSDKPVDDKALDTIIAAGHHAPSSCNAQHVSVVVVRDPVKRAQIAKIAGDQVWVSKAPVFLAVVFDLYKTERSIAKTGGKQLSQTFIEGGIAVSLDVGIATASMAIAARSLGLGIVPIGGVRNDPQAMIDLLALPPLSFVAVGLCVGHVLVPSVQRPRLDISTFRHEEIYRTVGLEEAIDEYNARLLAHWENVGRPNGEDWSCSIAPRFDRNTRPKLKPTLAKQGLILES